LTIALRIVVGYATTIATRMTPDTVAAIIHHVMPVTVHHWTPTVKRETQ